MSPRIGILMATCNGAAFLADQLESLAAQDWPDWHLHVRDDASDDATPAILARFGAAHPERVTLHGDTHGRLGARTNFARLMALSHERYVAFCDQDDVWHPDKLVRSMAAMRRLEADHPGAPCLVHADRRLVDAGGHEITPSYWGSRAVAPGRFDFGTCLSFCLAAGATMLVNRALLDRALPVPPEARMHDTWLELVAQAFGAVAALEDGVVLDWRRHGSNASGGGAGEDTRRGRRPWARAARLLGNLERQRGITAGYVRQAAAFRARFGAALSGREAAQLAAFLSLPDLSLPRRVAGVLRAGIGPPGAARTLALAALSGRPSQASGAVPPLHPERAGQ